MTTNEDESRGGNRINAVENAFTIVEALRDNGRCGVSALADDLELPKSTAHVYLKTLHELGYVVKTDGQYQLSLRFLELGGRVRHDRQIYQAAKSEVDGLSRTTGEVGTLGCEENGMRVLVYRSEPAEGVSDNAPTGEFTRLHWTAVGKVLLAQQSNDEIRDLADRFGLPVRTDQTITDIDELLEEVDTIRSQEYSIEDEERVSGIKSVAVPIAADEPAARTSAISVAGPKHRFDDERIEEELLPELRNAANVIELQYKHY